MNSPSSYRPQSPTEFIGTASSIAAELFRKAERLQQDPKAFFRGCFYGPPGIGKTELALVFGRHLGGHELAVELVNGASLSVEVVRGWKRDLCCRPMYGTWHVKILDEVDKGSDAAQCELLTLLDKRLPRTAFIATTNLTVDEIPKRNVSRMQLYKFKPVETSELSNWLHRMWGIALAEAERIAKANGGDVRGACNDTESHLDRMAMAA